MNGLCSIDILKSVLAGTLSGKDESSLMAHLNQCASCSAAMEKLAAEPAFIRDVADLLTRDALDEMLPQGDQWSLTDFCVEYLEPSGSPDCLGRLGSYEITRIIGRGGMSVVLKGFESELKRHVAIKVLAPNLAHSPLARKRFAREAQAAAAVVHPHVLAIHQVHANGRLPFIVMPLINGESLAERLASQGLLDLKEVLRIGLQAASGLAAAHEQGLVHRDVKPANIMLEHGVERALLTDFGLARAADDVAITRCGIIAGTPQYMSPEQARGECLDARSDLFSLGCVLYEMTTGVSPFKADSTLATLRRLVDDHPQPMTSLNPELPGWFVQIVERLLEKDPSRRFSSASEVSEFLAACLAHIQQPAAFSIPQLATLPDRARPKGKGLRNLVSPQVAVAASVGLAAVFVVNAVLQEHYKRQGLERLRVLKAQSVAERPAPATEQPNPRIAKFATLDVNQDGKLSFAEFSAHRDPMDAERWFDRRDVDQDGTVSFEEYFPFSVPPARVPDSPPASKPPPTDKSPD